MYTSPSARVCPQAVPSWGPTPSNFRPPDSLTAKKLHSRSGRAYKKINPRIFVSRCSRVRTASVNSARHGGSMSPTVHVANVRDPLHLDPVRVWAFAHTTSMDQPCVIPSFRKKKKLSRAGNPKSKTRRFLFPRTTDSSAPHTPGALRPRTQPASKPPPCAPHTYTWRCANTFAPHLAPPIATKAVLVSFTIALT